MVGLAVPWVAVARAAAVAVPHQEDKAAATVAAVMVAAARVVVARVAVMAAALGVMVAVAMAQVDRGPRRADRADVAKEAAERVAAEVVHCPAGKVVMMAAATAAARAEVRVEGTAAVSEGKGAPVVVMGAAATVEVRAEATGQVEKAAVEAVP